MIARLIRADLRRSAVVSLTLALLVAVAATLTAVSAGLVGRTAAAIDSFWAQSGPPDVVQMHTGPLDPAAIDAWVRGREDVVDHQVITTLPVPGSALWLRGVPQTEAVLEPALVVPTKRFDLLLDPKGRPVAPGPGEIAMPVHYLAEEQLALGDEVRIRVGEVERRLRVVSFARDAQMNPSLVTSKRLVVNPADFQAFAPVLEPEYLVELRLAEGVSARGVQDAYVAAGLPSKGIAVDSSIFRLMNGMSTYLVAAVALLVALLLVAVAALALRFAFLTAVEEDLPEIATLKAIGAPSRALKGLFLAKYAVLATLGSLVGLALALVALGPVSRPITLYLGQPEASVLQTALPIVAAALTALLVIGFCWLLLRRLDTLSATQALRGQASRARVRRRGGLSRTRLDPHTWLGVTAGLRPGNLLLAGVVAVCTFTMVLPLAVAQTVEDPRFATYLGVGQAAVRIDVREGAADLAAVAAAVERDPAVTKHVVLLSSRQEMLTAEGEWESVLVEAGDHDAFPLSYEEGSSPRGDGEIALSHNQASVLGARSGQEVRLRESGRERTLRVSGVYQDITNGGRTAKARRVDGPALWQVIYLDTADSDLDALVGRLQGAFPGAKVTRIADHASQTMGATTSQLRTAGVAVAIGSGGLVLLITTLFGVLLVARSRRDAATLAALGATPAGVIRQLAWQLAIPAGAGVLAAVLLAATLGRMAFAAALGYLGAPGVVLMPDVLVSYVALPLAMALVVAAGCALALRRLRHLEPLTQE